MGKTSASQPSVADITLLPASRRNTDVVLFRPASEINGSRDTAATEDQDGVEQLTNDIDWVNLAE